MKKVLSAVFAIVLGLVALDVVQAATTVTNRGQVITVQKSTDTATDVRDLDVFQDMSVYPTRPGVPGKIVRWYDFDKLGGAVGTVKLVPEVAIPDNVLVRDGYIRVVTAVASADGASTNSITFESAGDIAAAATNLLATTGTKATVPVGTAATAKLSTAERYLTTTIVGNPITAGKYMVVLDCELVP